MPFYLTNENIEATMERNPDDIFTPSDLDHNYSIRNIGIKELISDEIKKIFKINEVGEFFSVDSIKEDVYSSYFLVFETDEEEYEMMFLIPLTFEPILKQFNDDILLNLSNSIITSLNEQDFAFLQDIRIVEFKKNDIEDMKSLKNIYSYNMIIDKKKSHFYLQFDNQFNKIF